MSVSLSLSGGSAISCGSPDHLQGEAVQRVWTVEANTTEMAVRRNEYGRIVVHRLITDDAVER
jgi:hypothetical protein